MATNLSSVSALPAYTTDALPIRNFSEIDLRVGPAPEPFDPAKWEPSAKHYDVLPPTGVDPDDPRVLPLNARIPVSDWNGKRIAVAVRTSIQSGDHYSVWSAPAILTVVEPLPAPKIKADATRDGYKLTWPADREGLHYEVLRQGGSDKNPAEVGVAEKSEFVDVTSQWDVPYTYFVVAKQDSAESLPSEGVMVNHADTFAPTVPSSVTALAGPDFRGAYLVAQPRIGFARLPYSIAPPETHRWSRSAT